MLGVLDGFLWEEWMESGEFEVEVGAPEFCVFGDVEGFERVLYLGEGVSR